MADTVMVTLDKASWTDIGSTGDAGFASIESGRNGLIYRFAAADPGVEVTDGHSIRNNEQNFFRWDSLSAETVWARAMGSDETKVAVTTNA